MIYSAEDFSNLSQLSQEVRSSGESVSLVIPTLNEARTVGAILDTVLTDLVRNHSVVNEVLVVDGGSTDGTQEVAHERGVSVLDARYGIGGDHWKGGKGLALWRSQFYTRGDIILFIDADIHDFTSRFVAGLLGPFFTPEKPGFVKSFYRRPFLGANGTYQPTGGGRVTELLVRPFLSYFFPAATELIQPLSGEYGFRRSILETLPFYTGYGVETALVVRYIQKYGIERVAQVNMGERRHRNRDVHDLSKMSYAILQTCLELAEEDKAVSLEKLDFSGFRLFSGEEQILDSTLLQDMLPPAREIV
ncbi:glucosyl-3-phosphoglycerate synthase [Chitinivibrio alkaliphilus]|uniref:Glycosyl transferase family 2 n=1 Tax=Chitinivibrio alkaliphilus ACht1 TaxID=1313304 RepID=U7D4Q0_9BACT|nr:glucosyl-3-phosphoglycerate synthase [Chitinivibrio alkaliphilus]ERP30913.1 glycosyl transferase family 2 [Chitinivibrio alkaliphilus ACht1]